MGEFISYRCPKCGFEQDVYYGCGMEWQSPMPSEEPKKLTIIQKVLKFLMNNVLLAGKEQCPLNWEECRNIYKFKMGRCPHCGKKVKNCYGYGLWD